MESACYTAKEMCNLLGISKGHLYRSAAKGDIPNKRIGHRIIFYKITILHWLEEQGGMEQ